MNVEILEVEKFIDYSFIGELASLRESENKYRQQYVEASHREKILVRRLASKEQELQEYIVCNYSQIHQNFSTIYFARFICIQAYKKKLFFFFIIRIK